MAFQLVLVLLFWLSGCQPRQTVTLALLGDVMLGRGVQPTQDSLATLAPELSSADLALANLESPFGIPGGERPAPMAFNLCAPPDMAGLLSGWGLDLVSIANNHGLDCGAQGAEETRATLAAAGIEAVGPGMQPVYRQVNGLKLAFLAFNDVSFPLDENAAVQAIRAARETGALVVVSVHWGAEYQAGASDRQKALAAEFAEAGAALVWGHHPHVLQPAAWIETAQGRTLVLYSLGNALFDQDGLEDTRQSALAVVTLDAGGVTGVRAVPFEIDVLHSRVVQADEATAEKIRERLGLPSDSGI